MREAPPDSMREALPDIMRKAPPDIMCEALSNIADDLIDYFLKNRGTATSQRITETLKKKTLINNVPLINSFLFKGDDYLENLTDDYLENITKEANAITIARFGGGRWDLWDSICQFFKMYFCFNRDREHVIKMFVEEKIIRPMFVEEKIIRKVYSTYSKCAQFANEVAGKNKMRRKLYSDLKEFKDDFKNKDVIKTCFSDEKNVDNGNSNTSKAAEKLARYRKEKAATVNILKAVGVFRPLPAASTGNTQSDQPAEDSIESLHA